MKRICAGAVLGMAAVLMTACGEREAAPPPPPAVAPSGPAAGEEAVEVRRARVRRETACVGELRARRTTRVGAQVSGRVDEVLVREGDAVTAGQELVRLDTTTFALEIAVREAEREVMVVARTDASLQFERIRALWDKPAGEEPSIPRKQFDDAKARLSTAEVHVKLADAALELARRRLTDAVIRAPYDGIVTRRFVDPGQPVTSAPVTELLEIRDVASLDLEFRLPQRMLSRVSAATVLLWEIEGVADGRGESTLSLILPDLDEATRTFRCRTVLPNPDGRLRPGLLARVRVVEDSPREALYIPAAAIVSSQRGPSVRVLEGGRPALRPVRTGESWGDFLEVLEGLSPGDRILVAKTP